MIDIYLEGREGTDEHPQSNVKFFVVEFREKGVPLKLGVGERTVDPYVFDVLLDEFRTGIQQFKLLQRRDQDYAATSRRIVGFDHPYISQPVHSKPFYLRPRFFVYPEEKY